MIVTISRFVRASIFAALACMTLFLLGIAAAGVLATVARFVHYMN